MHRTVLPYRLARTRILPGDVLSYRLPRFLSDPLGWLTCKPIAVAGRGPEVHTAMVDDDQSGCLIALGMRLGKQKLKKLSHEVKANPGLIDVYRLWPPLEPQMLQEICNEMRRFALADQYGWLNVLRSGLYVFPVLRYLVPLDNQLEANETRPYCSQAVAESIRRHYRPLLGVRPPRHTLPADVPLSSHLKYLFTLTP